jgi:hypothetical protein
MANRHANKKLRAAIRARMEATGESYQKAREVLRRPDVAETDLVACSYFGVPGALATFALRGRAFAVLIPSARGPGRGYPHPYPLGLLGAAMRTRGNA